MHAASIVTRVLGPCLVGWHRKRVDALMRCCTGLLDCGVLRLSAIALRIGGSIAFKHRLKSVDRLLSNPALHANRWTLYRALAQRWLIGLPQVLLVVDWSALTRDQRWHLLRASVVVQSRSITLYEEVHPQTRYAHPTVHRRFLMRVNQILPAGAVPIVMTDAGFHAPWFKLIEQFGWHFVGRVRGRNRLHLPCRDDWIPARDFFAQASRKALELGCGDYSRANPAHVRAVLTKCPKKFRHRRNIYGERSRGRKSAKNARSASEPWLLVSSQGLSHLNAAGIVSLYAQRMRIEESFRDIKSLKLGLGMETCLTRKQKRIEVLLLLAHLASFVQRLIGERVQQRQLELQFVAKRRADRPEASVMTLGRRVLLVAPRLLSELHPWQALGALTDQALCALDNAT
jgi:Transposase DDE domain